MTGRDYLKIPELEEIFDSAYDAGARVHSNSWGNVGGIYGQLAMDVDKYLHQHEDFFVLFAGGNEGYSGLRSVIAPGNAKNCLTVGATQLRTVAEDERLDDRVSHTTGSTRSTVQYCAVQCSAGRCSCCTVWFVFLMHMSMLHFCNNPQYDFCATF
jgi:hypothetical protein